MHASTGSPIKTQVKNIDGLSVRYAETEPRDVSAILLSPWPESLHTFEQMWSRLAEHAHLVAIDLPGVRHSEQPDKLLKSPATGEFVAHAIEAFELTQPHAVGPDIGTFTLRAKQRGPAKAIVDVHCFFTADGSTSTARSPRPRRSSFHG